jgi:hypothetical protein
VGSASVLRKVAAAVSRFGRPAQAKPNIDIARTLDLGATRPIDQ